MIAISARQDLFAVGIEDANGRSKVDFRVRHAQPPFGSVGEHQRELWKLTGGEFSLADQKCRSPVVPLEQTFLSWERRHFGQGLGDARGGRRKELKTRDRRSPQQTG